jgi:hypothetical protein
MGSQKGVLAKVRLNIFQHVIIAFYSRYGSFDRRTSRAEAAKKRWKVLFLSAL